EPNNSEIGKETKFTVEDYDSDFFTPELRTMVGFKDIIAHLEKQQKKVINDAMASVERLRELGNE
ncbi:MAG: hypothetical protein J5U16_06075, partial [Candidatus Methanoperedens sp.]|nr:hypothetical protein [Candidatus Methanoperedens sp.]